MTAIPLGSILNDGKLSIEPRKVFQVIANTAKIQEAEKVKLGMTNSRSKKGKTTSQQAVNLSRLIM